MNSTETPNRVASSAGLSDIGQRLEKCNARARAFKELPPILHDGDWEKFERLKTERLTEEIAIMAEAMGVMEHMDALLSANSPNIQRSSANPPPPAPDQSGDATEMGGR